MIISISVLIILSIFQIINFYISFKNLRKDVSEISESLQAILNVISKTHAETTKTNAQLHQATTDTLIKINTLVKDVPVTLKEQNEKFKTIVTQASDTHRVAEWLATEIQKAREMEKKSP